MPDNIEVNKDKIETDFRGGCDFGIHVTSDYKWTATSSDESVVKAYTYKDELLLFVMPSVSSSSTSATVTLSYVEFPAIKKTISVTRGAAPSYIVPGIFTVGDLTSVYTDQGTKFRYKYVYFSKGNLQYQASTKTWRFAESQLDWVGFQSYNSNWIILGVTGTVVLYDTNNAKNLTSDNRLISPTYEGWIDLFGWGTGDNPTNTSEESTDYSTFTDWGVNPISNGGNTANMWRTLTKDEWYYLRNKRQSGGRAPYSYSIDWSNVPYYLIYPDGTTLSAGTVPNITMDKWNELERNGTLALPYVFQRQSDKEPLVEAAGGSLYYWTATSSDDEYAYGFTGSDIHLKEYGFAVRLVMDAMPSYGK